MVFQDMMHMYSYVLNMIGLRIILSQVCRVWHNYSFFGTGKKIVQQKPGSCLQSMELKPKVQQSGLHHQVIWCCLHPGSKV